MRADTFGMRVARVVGCGGGGGGGGVAWRSLTKLTVCCRNAQTRPRVKCDWWSIHGM